MKKNNPNITCAIEMFCYFKNVIFVEESNKYKLFTI